MGEELEQLKAANVGLVAELSRVQTALAEAAREINCAGPVAHRIRVLKQEWSEHIDRLEAELAEAKQWIDDCQAGMYINCVYCGHRYGPDDEVEATMQQALYDHIKVCPKHPLSKALAENTQLKEELKLARKTPNA